MHANGYAKVILPWVYKIQEECSKKFFVKVQLLEKKPTWLKTFSLKALELHTFILTCTLHKTIQNTMIQTAFGYTTKLFY